MKKFQTVVFLIRHGATDIGYSPFIQNDDRRVLTNLGKEQAEAVGRFLRGYDIAQIYTSAMRRTVQTAQVIQQVCGGGVGITIETQLHEIYPIEPTSQALKRPSSIIHLLADKHKGEVIAVVTHQFVIGQLISQLEEKDGWREIIAPNCALYRVVFADGKIVFWQYLDLFQKA